MLTLWSELRTLRIDRRVVGEWVSKRSDVVRIDRLNLTHPALVELEAYMKGEVVSYCLMEHLVDRLEYRCQYKVSGIVLGEELATPLQCSDGPCTVPYAPATLSRHFLYFRHFIDEHPGEPVPLSLTCDEATEVLDAFLVQGGCEPLSKVLYAMQLFTPVDDRYYFLFEPRGVDPSVVLSLLGGITPEGRREQMSTYHSCGKYAVNMEALPLEEDAALLATFQSWRAYFATPKGLTLAPTSTSWLFVNACDCLEFRLAKSLFEQGFNDECDPVTDGDKSFIEGMLVEYMRHGVPEHDSEVCTMLDIRHSMFANWDSYAMPPFQIVVDGEEARKNHGATILEIKKGRHFTREEAVELLK